MKNIILSTCFVLVNLLLYGQDPMADQFSYYHKAKPSGNLFVHFDKNIYASNETVWFTAYLINARDLRNHRLLSVALINETSNSIALEDRFLIENGLAFGSIVLPDSIQPGNYRFQVITDYIIDKMPEATFIQPIAIKSILEPPFKASMKIISSDGKKTQVLVSATTADNRFLAKPVNVTYTYGQLKKVTKTDASGQALISLDAQENISDANLHLKLSYDKDSTSLNMPIPQPKSSPLVKFYPEGGDLVTGLINNLGWEVKDQQRKPLTVKAYLYKNDVVIDTISSNKHGLGTFKIFVDDGAIYSLKLASAGLKDTLYKLPVAKQKGITINIANAVVADTLKINIRSKEEKQINLRIHNFKTSFIYTNLDLKSGLRTIKVPLTSIPKGLATITITDQENLPLAERIFFAHHDQAERINITTDKSVYSTREKVNLKIKLTEAAEKGIVSIAVVQDNRIEPNKMTDIESYTFLRAELAAMPIETPTSSYRDKKYLEQLLLIKGWRRYQWSDLSKTIAADTTHQYGNLKFTGLVTKHKKVLTEAVAVGAMGDSQIRLVNTSENGQFDFNTPQLYTNAGKKMYLFLNKNNDPSYKFTLSNQLLETGKNIINHITDFEKLPAPPLPDNAEFFVKTNEKSIRLKEVIITDKNVVKGKFGPNPCGDFVCPYGILNCRNHYGDPKNTQPIQGKTYKIDGRNAVYQGCNVTDESIFFKTDGIHIHKDFYVDSYKDPLEPAYFSTIFWKYATVLNDKEAAIDFYTSDISGRFRVVVQGITLNNVVYGERFLEVKKQ
jgi:hypothetical protein